jgi:CheY-like chemotaxis protein
MQHPLRRLGFAVFVARDGKGCLELAAQCQPELVTLDIAMPDLSGWDVARQLRTMAPPAAIMMISANAHDFRPGGREAPHDAFLMKPWDLDTLLERIGALLKLDWLYADEALAIDRPGGSQEQPTPPAPPSFAAHIDELRRLGRIGHVRAIETRLREISQQHADCGPLVSRLQGLVANFDFRAYLALLDVAGTDRAS